MCLHRGGGGQKKAPNCAYVIYEWYLEGGSLLAISVLSPLLLESAAAVIAPPVKRSNFVW